MADTVTAIVDNVNVPPWVSSRIAGSPGWGTGAVGIGWKRGETLIMGVVYARHSPGQNIEMAVAVAGRMPTRSFVEAFLYPFLQLNLPRVTALVDESNWQSIKFCQSVGFVREGLMRAAGLRGGGVIVYGMLARECKFLSARWLVKLARATAQERAMA